MSISNFITFTFVPESRDISCYYDLYRDVYRVYHGFVTRRKKNKSVTKFGFETDGFQK